jgi:hypothetical protein
MIVVFDALIRSSQAMLRTAGRPEERLKEELSRMKPEQRAPSSAVAHLVLVRSSAVSRFARKSLNE